MHFLTRLMTAPIHGNGPTLRWDASTVGCDGGEAELWARLSQSHAKTVAHRAAEVEATWAIGNHAALSSGGVNHFRFLDQTLETTRHAILVSPTSKPLEFEFLEFRARYNANTPWRGEAFTGASADGHRSATAMARQGRHPCTL